MVKKNASQTGKTIKRSRKQQRELEVLLGLVELYLKQGKPIGSNTLRENGFDHLSSATIRNYFSHLEEQGYLAQQHSSGGRAPTHTAYRLYVDERLGSCKPKARHLQAFEQLRRSETHEVASFLQDAAEYLSKHTELALFMGAPRFDHDFVHNTRLVRIDQQRYLCALITDFGLVHTEMLHSDQLIPDDRLAQMEAYFRSRFGGVDFESDLPTELLELANRFYNEVMVRYIVSYSNFMEEDIYRTGFSQVLQYPEFNDVSNLAGSLSLFENPRGIRLILRECCKTERLKCWIGNELAPYCTGSPDCAVVAAPYRIHQSVAGAIGLLGPTRIPYKELFQTLQGFAEVLSEVLTRNMYRFRINYRMPEEANPYLEQEERALLESSSPILLEDQTSKAHK